MKPVLALGALVALGLAAPGFAQTAATPPATTKPGCKQYTSLGSLYYVRGDFDAAYLSFRACVLLEPKNKTALYNLGRAETELRLYSAAIGHFTEAVGLDAKYVSAYIGLAQAYTQQYLGSSDRNSARSQLNQALRVLDDADKVATAATDKAKVANERGRIYTYTSELDKAIAAYTTAAGLNPTSSVILFNLGRVQLLAASDARELDAAIKTLRRSVDAGPGDAVARAYLSKALRSKNDLEGALSEASQAYNSSPAAKRNAFIVGQYGIALYLNKNMNAAKPALELATKLVDAPNYHENFFFLGRLYLDTAAAKDAKTAFTKASTIARNDDPEYLFYLGRSNEALGLKDDACKSFKASLSARPGYKLSQDASTRLQCR